jgi:hypothetical protein
MEMLDEAGRYLDSRSKEAYFAAREDMLGVLKKVDQKLSPRRDTERYIRFLKQAHLHFEEMFGEDSIAAHGFVYEPGLQSLCGSTQFASMRQHKIGRDLSYTTLGRNLCEDPCPPLEYLGFTRTLHDFDRSLKKGTFLNFGTPKP